MSYRHHFYSIPKKEYEQIKGLSKKELIERYKDKLDITEVEDCGFPLYQLYEMVEGGNELFDFGDFWDVKPLKKMQTIPFFTNKKTQSNFADEEPHLITDRRKIAYTIELFRDKVVKYHMNKLEALEKGNKFEVYSYFEHKLFGWGVAVSPKLKHLDIAKGIRPYNLIKDNAFICSDTYEYSIFELVRLYKTFDFKNNVILFMGW